MIRILLSIVVLLVGLAGCDELSSHDDPRDSDEFIGDDDDDEDGSCLGLALDCEQLTETWCPTTSGCTWSEACFGNERDQCFARTSEDACDADNQPYCEWEDARATCFAPSSGPCPYQDSLPECEYGAFECSWGPTCRGDATRCYELSDRASCDSQPGCEWSSY